jgi:hypothetical protein
VKIPTWVACGLLVAWASGCNIVPPVPLDEDRRWGDLFDEGYIPERATVYVEAPTLAQPAVDLQDEFPISIDDEEKSTYWPQELPTELVREVRRRLAKRTGYQMLLWEDGKEPPSERDYDLRLTVTKLALSIDDVGMGSAMASMWPFFMPHMATYYLAPDEWFRCEYELEVAFVRPKTRAIVHGKRLKGTTVKAMTDFQRGWTFGSYWPDQALGFTAKTAAGAWASYGPEVLRQVEPHARRELVIDLMRFLRRDPPPDLPRSEPAVFGLTLGYEAEGSDTGAVADAQALDEALDVRDPGFERIRSLVGPQAISDEAQRELWGLVGRTQAEDVLFLYVAAPGTLLPGDEGGPVRPAVRLADRVFELERLFAPLRAARRRGAEAAVILDLGLFGGSRSEAGAQADTARVLARLGERLEGVTLLLTGAAAEGASGGLGRALASAPAQSETLAAALERLGALGDGVAFLGDGAARLWGPPVEDGSPEAPPAEALAAPPAPAPQADAPRGTNGDEGADQPGE